MKRKYIFILSGLTAVVFFAMIMLKASVKEMNYVSNGFERKAGIFSVTKIAERTFKQPLRDIAGVSGDRIFIVTTQPDKIILTNGSLTDEKMIDLAFTVPKNLTGNFTTSLRNGKLYIFGSNVPCIIQYDLTTSREVVYPVDRAFSRGVMLSSSSVLLRGFNVQFNDERLQKIDLSSGSKIEENGITDKTEGGGFVTDGQLQYDDLTNMAVYTHFYSNKILYLDTNLQLIRTGSSIDTFSHYTAQAKAISSEKGTYFTFSKPPRLLSENSCVNNGRLFIQSRLKADNETPDQFSSHTILDMYNISSGAYAGSLYMPALPGKRLLNFKVLDNKLYALYENRIIVYRMQ